MRSVFVLLAALVSIGASTGRFALALDNVPESKRTVLQKYLSAQEAYDWKIKASESTFLIDVRTPAELQLVGFALAMDANIPYMTYDYGAWDDKIQGYKQELNSSFGQRIDAFLAARGQGGRKDARLVLLCRSGDRSAKAANLLAKIGYTEVWSVAEGFEGDRAKEGEKKGQRVVNGWKNVGLPWSYDLTKDKAGLLD